MSRRQGSIHFLSLKFSNFYTFYNGEKKTSDAKKGAVYQKTDENVTSAMHIFIIKIKIQGDPRVPKVNFVGTRSHFLGTRGPRVPVSHLP